MVLNNGLISAGLCLIFFLGVLCPENLLLERDGLTRGEYWRLLSGHWSHIGFEHGLLNFVALIILLFWAKLYKCSNEALLFLIAAAPLLSVLILLWMPGLNWYSGLSGLLHGLTVMLLLYSRNKLAVMGVLLMTVKLLVESHGWSVTPDQPHHQVIYQAHFLGALLGLAWALVGLCLHRPRQPLVVPVK